MKKEEIIPVFKPSVSEKEIKAISQILKSGWWGLGPKTKEFEEKFAEYIGVKYAIGVNSCTAALNLAINVLEIKEREIITTPISFVSTSHAILYNNCKPVFVDVEEDTLNIDISQIKKSITNKTKAIIPVHYGGHACEMGELEKIVKEKNLFLIEDCAHATGGKYKEKMLGSIGDIGCFSFHAVKNLATGDGGMITTNNKEIYEKLKRLRWMGITKDTFQRNEKKYDWMYDVLDLGFKCHMNDITATLGLCQLERIEETNNKRRKYAEKYIEELSNIKKISLPGEKNYATSSWHNFVIKVENGQRDELQNYLKGRRISTGVHYRPITHFTYYKENQLSVPLPISDSVWKKLLTLPLYPDLGEKNSDKIINCIKKFF